MTREAESRKPPEIPPHLFPACDDSRMRFGAQHDLCAAVTTYSSGAPHSRCTCGCHARPTLPPLSPGAQINRKPPPPASLIDARHDVVPRPSAKTRVPHPK